MLRDMKRASGFTLIELLITISIMVILMTLAVVNIRGTLVQARDEERKSDVETMARGLEQRYNVANPKLPSAAIAVGKGSYPDVNEMLHALGFPRAGFTPEEVPGGYLPELLPGTTKKTFKAPDVPYYIKSVTLMCVWACQPAETQSVVDAMTTGINKENYVYEPIDRNGNICCCGGCIRYNLYYRTEADGALHVVKSKHQ